MDPKTVVQQFWASYQDGDLDTTWETYVSPGLVIHPSSGYEFTRASWLATEKDLVAAFDGLSVVVLDQVAEGSKVATRWQLTGTPLDAAPPPNGRRRTDQTPRMNKRLVHVIVLVEGRQPPSAEFMTGLCEHVMPDVFEDHPRIGGFNERRFKGDGYDLGLTFGLMADDAYGTDNYDVQVYPGQHAGQRGQRWVIVKIFENWPKHVDPDDPATGG